MNPTVDTRIERLIDRGDKLFSDKQSLHSLRQEIAEHFYPERATFTRQVYLGEDFASGLMSSYPVLMRRELGDAFSSYLRPSELAWFEVTVEDDDRLDRASKAWLERATRITRRAMYDRVSGFVRATKQGDHDFAAFGETVISVDYNPRNVAMLYRTWHTRDCAWVEAIDGSVGELHINWSPTVSELAKRFAGKLHPTLDEALRKEPHRTVKCRRVVLLAEDHEPPLGVRWPFKWVSLTVDVENKCVLEEISTRRRGFVVPRWQTVSGSQYAHSPATIIGLPDARLIQAMTLTLLEAGEMAVRPPMLAEKDIVREDVQMYAGGITWIDGDYDKRKHDVLRTLSTEKHALPIGFDMSDRVHQQLAAVFYLNKLTLPPSEGKEMTAYEVRERIKEYLRIARPLFEPAEAEYNGGLVDETFEELLSRGAFGPMQEIPPQLQGRQTIYKFESPLHEAIDRQDAVTFLEGKQALLEAMEIDPAAKYVVNARTALRGALKAVKFKADWMRDEREVEQLAADEQEQQQTAAAIAAANEGAQAAERLGKASAAIAP